MEQKAKILIHEKQKYWHLSGPVDNQCLSHELTFEFSHETYFRAKKVHRAQKDLQDLQVEMVYQVKE